MAGCEGSAKVGEDKMYDGKRRCSCGKAHFLSLQGQYTVSQLSRLCPTSQHPRASTRLSFLSLLPPPRSSRLLHRPHDAVIMSSSMVHLAVAAIAGVTLGVGTTLAMRPSPSEKRTSRTEEPLLPTRPLAGAAPGAGGVGVPSKVYHGGLTTGTELAKSVMLPGAIGASSFLSLPHHLLCSARSPHHTTPQQCAQAQSRIS